MPLAEPALASPLTAAEREVASAALAGHSTAEIAAARGSSPRTIANLLARAYRKAGVRSRFELAARIAGLDLAARPTPAPPAPRDSRLSAREREVLAQLLSGACNKTIAYELGLTEGSVNTYLKRVAAKVGVRGRLALIQWGSRAA